MNAIEFHNQLLDLKHSLERFAYSLTLNNANAMDLLQETFLKALMNKEKYVVNENFKAWTFTIMRNIFINTYRRGLHRNTYMDVNRESFFVTQAKEDYSGNPDSTYSALEITQHIEKLKEPHRTPFKLLISGYKYKEIASYLNLNIGTVKSRIYFSRKQLMNQLSR
ncbi:MAG TPA: RNA polymerase sigma factor [Bacteroidales bacterium]|nr:RNA polymerase sigma factor [Bacteroidales bacterium]